MDIHELTGIEEMEKQKLDPHVEPFKVQMNLDSVRQNVSNDQQLVGIFCYTARKQGMSESEVNAIRENALSADHEHLLKVLSSYCIPVRYDETPSIEQQLNDVIDEFEASQQAGSDLGYYNDDLDEDSWYDDDELDDEFEDFDDWDDEQLSSNCDFCARPDSDCESCPNRG